jgi:xylan 1,4-beta-xylosidase
MIKKSLLTILGLALSVSVFAQEKITIKNPILQGFYPDPSIERVGDDYYLINSTFAYFPGLPIFHSKDLKNWKLISHAIERPSQMMFDNHRTSEGLFAPAISYYEGTFYVVCTNVRWGNFVVTATNPAGPWSDPVRLPEVSGIDPSVCFIDGKAYILYNSEAPDNKPLYEGHRTIKQVEFDYKNLKVISEPRILVNGGVDISKKPVWIEGPHLFKRGNYYYISAAEGGTSVNHSQVILRSDSPTGPFVPWEKNPIMSQRDLDPKRANPITSTGHADLFIGPDNNWYAVYLAVRPYEGNHYNTGRETFISPVSWTEDGWPVIIPKGQEVKYEHTFNWKEQPIKGSYPLNENFTYKTKFDKLDDSFIFLRNYDEKMFSTGKNGLTINLKPETVNETKISAFIGRRLMHMSADFKTTFEFTPKTDKEDAGIVLYQSDNNTYNILKTLSDGKQVLELRKSKKGGYDVVAKKDLKGKQPVNLEVKFRNDKIDVSYSEGKDKLQSLAAGLDGKHLSTQTAGGFVGVTIGMYGSSNGTSSSNAVTFKTFEYQGKDKVLP